jgi:membrane protein
MLGGVARARTLGLAAEMSFWVFLSLVPLAAVVGWLAARVATTHSTIGSSMLAGVPPDARQLVQRQLERLAASKGSTVAPLAIATFVWLAASGVHAVFSALEVQTGRSRPWWKTRALAIVTCVALAMGTAVIAILGTGFVWAGRQAESALPPVVVRLVTGGDISFVVRSVLAAVLAIGMTVGIYRVGVPKKEGQRLPMLPGAMLSVVLQALLGFGYGLYVARLGTGSAYQAGLAVVGVTLMTLWLFSIALLLGVNLNAAIARVRRELG